MIGNLRLFASHLIFILSVLFSTLYAQEAAISSSNIAKGEKVEVQISFRATHKIGEVKLVTEDFVVESTGRAYQTSIVNGSISSLVVFTFSIKPKDQIKFGKYSIESIQVDGNNQKIQPAPLQIVVTESMEKNSEGLDFIQIVDHSSPYVGEQIKYQAKFASSKRLSNSIASEPKFDNFWFEKMSEPNNEIKQIGDYTIQTYTELYALYPSSAGKFSIPIREMKGDIIPTLKKDPFNGFDQLFKNFFKSRSAQNFLVKTDVINITVKPLPEVNSPLRQSQGYIPVGNFNIYSNYNKFVITNGEAVDLVVEIRGDGNLRPLNFPKFSKIDQDNFRYYQDSVNVSADFDQAQGRLFHKKTFRFHLIPRQNGKLVLPKFEFLFFEPKTSTYKILSTIDQSVDVSGVTSRAKVEKKSDQIDQSLEIAPKVKDRGNDFINELFAAKTPKDLLIIYYKRASVFNLILGFGTISLFVVFLLRNKILSLRNYSNQRYQKRDLYTDSSQSNDLLSNDSLSAHNIRMESKKIENLIDDISKEIDRLLVEDDNIDSSSRVVRIKELLSIIKTAFENSITVKLKSKNKFDSAQSLNDQLIVLAESSLIEIESLQALRSYLSFIDRALYNKPDRELFLRYKDLDIEKVLKIIQKL